jgi:UPF0755 protein
LSNSSKPHLRRRRQSIIGVAIKAFIGLVIIVLVGVAGVGIYGVMAIGATSSSSTETLIFTIDKGDTVDTIAEKLKSAGLIEQPLLFRALVKYRGVESQLQAGEFEIRRDMSMDQLLTTFEHAPVKAVTFTIPEGLRATEIAEILAKTGLTTKDEFMNQVQNGSFDYDFLKDRPDKTSLEGYLFPDTYKVPADYKAVDIVDMMLRNFDDKLTPTMRDAIAKKDLTIYQVVTMASIVEREAVVSSERPTIASVYYNRLAKDMLLQADPTIQYAVGKEGAWWKKDLSQEDLAVDSLYNTYRYNGLPPGPICNPGLASLEAAVAPDQTGYLYFVAKGDGSHVFAETLDEHNANVQKYQQGQQ